MRDIPVFCDSCGTPFRSGISAGSGVNISIGSFSCGPCPACGGRGTLSNVVVNITQDAIRILGSGSAAGAAEMERLRALIERAQQREVPPAELVAELEQGDSTWQRLGALLSQLLVPKDAGQFFGLLALLLAAWPMLQPKEELTPAKIATIVETAVQRTMDKAQPAAQQTARPLHAPRPMSHAVKKKVGRNDPCHCASGKKYKHCCGNTAGR